MASIAQVRSGYVRHTFTGSHSAIMTTDTGLGAYGAVIKGQNYPRLGVMTHLTSFRCGHMQGSLTRGNHAVVTTLAGANHFVMIHRANERYPTARGGVTSVTII